MNVQFGTDMTDIYVVEMGEYSQRGVVGVYSNREDALKVGGDVTVWALDDGEVSSPTWHDVSFHPTTKTWTVDTYHDASKAIETETRPRWLEWENRKNGTLHRAPRVVISVFALDEDEAIRLAKKELDGKEIRKKKLRKNEWIENGYSDPLDLPS